MEEILKTEKLSVGYGGKIIVDGVDIAAYPGEVVAVIGPNGAGKSTLLKTLAGILKPVSGKIITGGVDYASLNGAELSKKVTSLLTERPKGDLMTVREVVAMGRYPYTGIMGRLESKDIERINEIIDIFKLNGLENEFFSRLSDGQKQRVMLAKTVCQDTPVILLDEPTSFLDIRYKLELLSLMYELSRKRKLSIIMTVHELELVRSFSDRIIAVKNGRIDKTGDTASVFTEEYVAELFDINSDESRKLLHEVISVGV
ncbi:MAG: ABC transporter ATP-binding protein [Eubacterium sp.]|nr:ABC transporter ATP-binding protein [Eubacterium sp.]